MRAGSGSSTAADGHSVGCVFVEIHKIMNHRSRMPAGVISVTNAFFTAATTAAADENQVIRICFCGFERVSARGINLFGFSACIS